MRFGCDGGFGSTVKGGAKPDEHGGVNVAHYIGYNVRITDTQATIELANGTIHCC